MIIAPYQKVAYNTGEHMSNIPENETVALADKLLSNWGDIRISLEELDKDLTKSLTRGNVAAGRRARSKIRNLKKALTLLTKNMISLEKSQESV